MEQLRVAVNLKISMIPPFILIFLHKSWQLCFQIELNIFDTETEHSKTVNSQERKKKLPP